MLFRSRIRNIIQYLSHWMVFRDPPEHTRLRKLTSKVFHLQSMNGMRPVAEDLVAWLFDRIRENLVRHAGAPFADIVNHSVVQTLGRSLNTTVTVLMTLLALLVFAGGSIRVFVLALFIGILSGTYSSIFNASPLLVWWEERTQARAARARSL